MRLNLKPSVERYELYPATETTPAVAIMARPALTEVMEGAKADPAIIEHASEIQAIIEAESEGTADVADMIRAKGRAGIVMAKAVARATIEDWEGIDDPDGSPAPVSPDRIDALLDISAIYDRYTEVYLARWLTVQHEKNGSAPSPTGTSAEAETTARRARGSAKTARKKPTSRKR